MSPAPWLARVSKSSFLFTRPSAAGKIEKYGSLYLCSPVTSSCKAPIVIGFQFCRLPESTASCPSGGIRRSSHIQRLRRSEELQRATLKLSHTHSYSAVIVFG